ncbi:hypothetical protein [uncultured Nitratireductor sp.]|uniref:hypothetical protein n=1 Tax=uncultured Nitratireductor sp. TaxID=520953 RepID=UPI0025F9362C|nr:hypothetical protein [uncultured Nitratireductor sp.]
MTAIEPFEVSASDLAMRETNPRFRDVLTLLGQLNYTWTNTESLLIHLIAGLARVDMETATVIFLTLNTSRARVDLVERLAKLDRTDANIRKDILNVTRKMMSESKLRNKYNHCIYSFDDSGENVSTLLMRISDAGDRLKYGKVDAIDDAEIANISSSINRLIATNREIWALAKKHGFPV